jgi:O-antigen ligase
MGVGAGNFTQKWGFEHGFSKKYDDVSHEYFVSPVHNALLQLTINWGVIGLVPFLAMIWQAYRCLPGIYGNDSLALGLLVIAVSLFLLMPFVTDIYLKANSLGLGILVAYQRWLRPTNLA